MMSGRVLSTCPSFTKVGPRSSQTSLSRRGRSWGVASVPVATRSIGRTIPSRWRADDHVVVAVPHQGREDLPVAGKIAEMADGFSEQGITAFALDAEA